MEKLKILANQVDGSFYDNETVYDNLSENVKSSGHWWYLHGQLQEDVGYDKGYIENIKPEQLENRLGYLDIKLNGIYEVEIKGISKPCIGYFWVDSMKFGRGLVCYKDDTEAIEYAREQYEKKSGSI